MIWLIVQEGMVCCGRPSIVEATTAASHILKDQKGQKGQEKGTGSKQQECFSRDRLLPVGSSLSKVLPPSKRLLQARDQVWDILHPSHSEILCVCVSLFGCVCVCIHICVCIVPVPTCMEARSCFGVSPSVSLHLIFLRQDL